VIFFSEIKTLLATAQLLVQGLQQTKDNDLVSTCSRDSFDTIVLPKSAKMAKPSTSNGTRTPLERQNAFCGFKPREPLMPLADYQPEHQPDYQPAHQPDHYQPAHQPVHQPDSQPAQPARAVHDMLQFSDTLKHVKSDSNVSAGMSILT
jgi:hypothetical protein